jgi:hypothetical protein
MLAPAIDYLGDQFLLRCMIAKFHNIAYANTAAVLPTPNPPNAHTHRAVAINLLFGPSHHLSE